MHTVDHNCDTRWTTTVGILGELAEGIAVSVSVRLPINTGRDQCRDLGYLAGWIAHVAVGDDVVVEDLVYRERVRTQHQRGMLWEPDDQYTA